MLISIEQIEEKKRKKSTLNVNRCGFIFDTLIRK